MGRLKSLKPPHTEVQLSPDHLVGRKQSCDLVLQHALVSSRHATVRWTESGWMLRDLGSRNGTWLNNKQLERGQELPLRAGATMVFGHASQRWTLSTDSPPEVRASCGEQVVWSTDGMLALPSEETPEAMVFPGTGGIWCAEFSDRSVVLQSGETLDVCGQRWTVELPGTVARTFGASGQPGLEDVTLEFEVSSDEEYVRLRCRVGAVVHDLGAYAHHYLLLTLARLYAQEADVPSEERGWSHIDDLSRMLRLEPRPLNVQVFRLRKQFAGLGLRDAGDIVQRRSRTGMLRLGPVQIGGLG